MSLHVRMMLLDGALPIARIATASNVLSRDPERLAQNGKYMSFLVGLC
jgi:hypothetical protein